VGTRIEVDESNKLLARLVRQAEKGEDITLTRLGRPVATLTSVETSYPSKRLGALCGMVPQFDDAEWERLDEEIRGLFRL
jgi:prevent-host-death family protein